MLITDEAIKAMNKVFDEPGSPIAWKIPDAVIRSALETALPELHASIGQCDALLQAEFFLKKLEQAEANQQRLMDLIDGMNACPSHCDDTLQNAAHAND